MFFNFDMFQRGRSMFVGGNHLMFVQKKVSVGIGSEFVTKDCDVIEQNNDHTEHIIS